MELDDMEQLLHRICVECNRGGDSHQMRLNKDAFIRTFSSLSDYMADEVRRLTLPEQAPVLRDTVAEATIIFLLSTKNDASRFSHEKFRNIFAAELCIAEPLYRVMRHLDMDFGATELWNSLLHFESEERTPPFTSDYFSADPHIRNRYIVHGCLDAVLPGNIVPDDILDYLVANFYDVNLTDICSLVHNRNSFSVAMLEEFVGTSSRSLALGVL